MTNLAFIGAGNMTRSIVAGLVNKNTPPHSISVSNPSPEKRDAMVKDYGVKGFANNVEAAQNADYIILSVKPHFIKTVCQELSDNIDLSGRCIVSVAAGITIEQIRTAINQPVSIVRAMPNTPALVGCGMTGLYASNNITSSQRQVADTLMASIGKVLWVQSEEYINKLLSVSGSGPAYFFQFMEHMQSHAIAMGFSAEEARLMVSQTAIGAAQMVVENPIDISTLRHNVTSKGGTTQAALTSFSDGNLQQLVTNAMDAALHRAIEIAENNR